MDFNQTSLLDADILVIAPGFPRFNWSNASTSIINGRILKWEEWAAQFSEETDALLNSGKNVFVFLQKDAESKYYNGTKTYKVSPYRILGYLINAFNITNNSGNEILFNNDPALSYYWSKYSHLSNYEVYFKIFPGRLSSLRTEVDFIPCFSTKVPEFFVGGILKINKSHVILLPNLNWDGVNREDLSNHIVNIDRYLRNGSERSIIPEWVSKENFPIPNEMQIINDISQLELKIEELKEHKNDLVGKQEELNLFRELLYENGKRLEHAIIKVLQLLGFSAEGYQDEESQFDVLFSSPEGRLIGEVEGKEKTAIDVSKFDQLNRNIDEDLNKEGTKDRAKGVIFGNAYRFLSPETRAEFFTVKCVNSAKRANISLVRSIDLYYVVKYLLENPDDEETKSKCRERILNGNGIINLLELLPVD